MTCATLNLCFLPVLFIVLHVELVENHLREPGHVSVQREKARLVGKDAVSPWSAGLRERWDLGRHVVAFAFHLEKNSTLKKSTFYFILYVT